MRRGQFIIKYCFFLSIMIMIGNVNQSKIEGQARGQTNSLNTSP